MSLHAHINLLEPSTVYDSPFLFWSCFVAVGRGVLYAVHFFLFLQGFVYIASLLHQAWISNLKDDCTLGVMALGLDSCLQWIVDNTKLAFSLLSSLFFLLCSH